MGFPSRLQCRARTVLTVLVFSVVCGVGWGASRADAQTQEGGTLDRILHPDRTMHYDGADKPFTVSSTVAGRQAVVKPYAFSHGANLGANNAAFSTRAFTPKDRFQTQAYTARTSTASGQGFAQTEKTFGTKSVDVREDRAAKKAMAVHTYSPGERTFLGRGTRQDSIDDLRKKKNLTVDQVREILNKNK